MTSGVNFIDNTVTIADDGTNSLGFSVTATDSDTTPVNAAPDMVLGKTDNNVTARPGQPVVYTLSYQNVGTQNATGVRIAEVVPIGTTFSATDSAPNIWTCPDGSPAGTYCVLTIGAVNVGTSGRVLFGVVVDQPIDSKLSNIHNIALVTDNGISGPDPTPDNNLANEDTPFPSKKIPSLNFWGLLLLITTMILIQYHCSRRKISA